MDTEILIDSPGDSLFPNTTLVLEVCSGDQLQHKAVLRQLQKMVEYETVYNSIEDWQLGVIQDTAYLAQSGMYTSLDEEAGRQELALFHGFQSCYYEE